MTATISHVAFECKRSITVLYRYDQVDDEARKVIINHLLEKDRFTCYSKVREVGVVFFPAFKDLFWAEFRIPFLGRRDPNVHFRSFY